MSSVLIFMALHMIHGEKPATVSAEMVNMSSLSQDKFTVADAVRNHSKILCFVLTQKKHHHSKARIVKETWGKRCDKLLFISSHKDKNISAIHILGVKEGRKYLWGKTKAALKHIYKRYLYQYDWFVKADDDTYLIVENLRFMLLPHSPSEPIYFGCKFRPFTKQGFMSGGAGYVLSQKALTEVVRHGFNDSTKCNQSNKGGGEDVELGICLANVGVRAGDSRDSKDRQRYFAYIIEHSLIPGPIEYWIFEYAYYPVVQGPSCCSDFAVSFHYVKPEQMLALEYYLYNFFVWGRTMPFLGAFMKNMTSNEIVQIVKTQAMAFNRPNSTWNSFSETSFPTKYR